MSSEYEYIVDEWSNDTRVWTIKSKVKLTREEAYEAWSEVGILPDEGEEMEIETIEGNDVTVVYEGVDYGDNCEYDIEGSFADDKELQKDTKWVSEK